MKTKQYCEFGKKNKCPYLPKCFDERMETNCITFRFEELPSYFQNNGVLSWIHYENKNLRKTISCIERIIIK